MALLDELKEEANKRKTHEETQLKESEKRDEYYRNSMLPKIIKVFNYLDELVKTITYLEREIVVDDKVDVAGDLTDLIQGEYKVSVDSTQSMRRVALSFACQKDERIEYSVKGERLIEHHVSYLLANKLDFDQKRKRNLRSNITESVFNLKAFVPVAISMEADIDNGEIILKVHNFYSLGTVQRTNQVDEITDEYLDSLGRYIMRQDESFLRHELSEDALTKIREKLNREEKRRAKELGMRVQQLHTQKEKEADGVLEKVRGKLGSFLGS